MKDLTGSYKAAFKGDHLQSAEFGDKAYTFRVRRVVQDELEDDKKGKVTKLVLLLDDHTGRPVSRGWVVSRTAAECLAAMFGPMVKDWIGKQVTLYSKPVRFGPEMTTGIRVAGSPDLAAPMPVTIKLPRKKPYVEQMRRTVVTPSDMPVDEPDTPEREVGAEG